MYFILSLLIGNLVYLVLGKIECKFLEVTKSPCWPSSRNCQLIDCINVGTSCFRRETFHVMYASFEVVVTMVTFNCPYRSIFAHCLSPVLAIVSPIFSFSFCLLQIKLSLSGGESALWQSLLTVHNGCRFITEGRLLNRMLVFLGEHWYMAAQGRDTFLLRDAGHLCLVRRAVLMRMISTTTTKYRGWQRLLADK